MAGVTQNSDSPAEGEITITAPTRNQEVKTMNLRVNTNSQGYAVIRFHQQETGLIQDNPRWK